MIDESSHRLPSRVHFFTITALCCGSIAILIRTESSSGRKGQRSDLRPTATWQQFKSINAREHGPGKNQAVAAGGRRSAGNVGSCGSDPMPETRLMSTATPAIRDFARRLIALEVACAEPTVTGGSEVVRVCDRLRLPLSKLTGDAGFRSLISRAVALAKAEIPSLVAVQVRADGSLEGLDGIGQDSDVGADGQAGVVVVAQLLGLLVTFIGEPLMLRLVRDAWPNASVVGIDTGSDEVL